VYCHVLASLQVTGPNGIVRPVARRQRIVLAMLLLEANHVVPIPRLVFAIWDDAPPSTAVGQVQTCLSALRRQLVDAGLPDVIATVSGGYLMRVPADQLDLAQFDELAARARAAARDERLREAAGYFQQALAIWTGAPLHGYESRVVGDVSAGLTERYLALLEESVEVRLRLGLHRELVPELTAIAAAHPFRERLCGYTMLALSEDGRQSDALELYRQTRRLLVDELGVEPGPALREVQRAVLVGENTLVPVDTGTLREQPSPRMFPPDISDFVGRDEELALVRTDISATADPESPRVVILTGPGGIGKSALSVRVARELAAAYPDGQLYANMLGAQIRPRDPAEVLDTFLRTLGVAGSAIPKTTDERSAVFRSRLARRKVLVLLDDAANEEQILPLLTSGDQVAFLVTSRFRLTNIPGARNVEVGLLPAGASVQLLEQVLGHDRVAEEPAAAEALVGLCEGLPLALRIAAARLASRPHWSITQLTSRLLDEHRRLDELMHRGMSIRANITVTHERLPKDAQRLFRLLALIDAPAFGKWVAVALLGMDETAAEDTLEALADVRLLEVDRACFGNHRYHFHDLIRLYAREQLAAYEQESERSAALHRLLGSWLGLAREAHRRFYGGDYTILHSDTEAWPLPESLVDDELRDPIAWYETERLGLLGAIRTTASTGLASMCWDLAISSVSLFEVRNYLTDWRQSHEIALMAVRRAGDRRGEAAMLYSLGAFSLSQGNLDDSASHLGRSLLMFEDLSDIHGIGLVQRHLAFIHRVRGDYGAALDLYQRAMDALTAAGDVIGRAHVLCNLAQVHTEHQEYEKAASMLTDAIEIARDAGCRRMEVQALEKLGLCLLERGEYEQAQRAFELVLSAAREMGDPVGESYALYGLGTLFLRLGNASLAGPLLGMAEQLAARCSEKILSERIAAALDEVRAGRAARDTTRPAPVTGYRLPVTGYRLPVTPSWCRLAPTRRNARGRRARHPRRPAAPPWLARRRRGRGEW
jgi:DNA-binding SARP family transcriptional activator/tetratricopeptide (TPR) repeat protein